jgi:hypothetical protein
MYLPPRGIKDAEGVGVCAQLFAVAECQPGALEIGGIYMCIYMYICMRVCALDIMTWMT